MLTHNVLQGTDAWHELRSTRNGASEAPIMMNASSKVRRNELLHMKATGSEREYSDWVQRHLFDKGHQYEKMARPLVEAIIGEELYPTTGTDDQGWLLASFDGITMLGDTVYEHKMWNESLAQAVRDKDLPAEYYWQLEQQLLVSGAERVIFVVSDGTRDNFEWMEYRPVEGRAKQLIAGWKQFEDDLANYTPAEQKPEAVGRTPENLPALRIEVSGQVTASNLAEYREHAITVIKSINRDLVTDQDFADAEKTVKWCKDVEDRLAAAKEHALSQTATIDELFKAIDDISAEARTTRLELNRLVTAEKENLRNKIRTDAEAAFVNHVERINKSLAIVRLPRVLCNVAGAMKGKRTLATLQDAADSEVARAKIEANELAADISEKLAWFNKNVANEYRGLFRDLDDLVTIPAKHFEATAIARVDQHQKAEAERLAAQRERIENEIKAKAEREEMIAQAQKVEPEPEAVLKQPVKSVAKIRPESTRSTMPSASEIISALADHFSVSESDVVGWLKAIDLTEASREALAF